MSPFSLRGIRGSQSSAQIEEKTSYIILSHICIVSQLTLTLSDLLARSLHTHYMCLSLLITCLPFLTERDTRQPELCSKRRKNKIYHASTHTQCFLAKTLPSLLCLYSLNLFPFLNTQDTLQPELWLKRRKNKIYHPFTYTHCFSAKTLPCLLC